MSTQLSPPSSLSPNLAVAHEMRPPPQQAVARLLLDRGAAIDHANNDGVASLFMASQEGHEPVVQLLLERGAAVDLTTSLGLTPLYCACARGRTVSERTQLSPPLIFVAQHCGHPRDAPLSPTGCGTAAT